MLFRSERIFLPFERSWAGDEQADTGSGLGLTICRMLTGIMGGELTVKSTQGAGSVFTLKLFLPALRTPSIGVLPQGCILGYEGPVRSVLTVDDQASQRRVLRDMLEPLGFVVHEAGSGAHALAILQENVPDLILMDISMPDMLGWDVCRAIRARGISIPIIMVSAKAYARPAAEVADGYDDLLTKPVIMEELLVKMGQHLNLAWRERAFQATNTPAPDDLHRVVLARDCAEALLELGAMGYIKGILSRLEAARLAQPDAHVLLDHLEGLARDFQLAQYQSTLKQHVLQHLPQAPVAASGPARHEPSS